MRPSLECDFAVGVASGVGAIVIDDADAIDVESYAVVRARDEALHAIRGEAHSGIEDDREALGAKRRVERQRRKPAGALRNELRELR